MKLFAVIGNPISHSRSPLIHNSAFAFCKAHQHCYTRILLNDESELRGAFERYGLDGANITIPFKEEAYRICDELDDYAANIGSVNTIIRKNGKLIGRNTDAPGFARAVSDFGAIKTVVILGAGGTTRAVATALKEQNIDFTIVNRSAKRLEFFKDRGYKTATFDSYIPNECDLLVNTTSAGLIDAELPCDKKLFDTLVESSKFGFDVIYGKKTPFIQSFETTSKPVKDGSDMLLFQAFFAYKSFFDRNFDENGILSAMKESFRL